MASPTVITTGHNADGKAVFIDSPDFKQVSPFVGVIYSSLTDGAINTNNNADVAGHNAHDLLAAGVMPKQGAIVAICEWPPNMNSEDKIHRTLTVDIGVIIQGQIECVLDSGERRTVKKGEVLIQRGTMHYWVNSSSTESARMLAFVMPSEKVEGLEGYRE